MRDIDYDVMDIDGYLEASVDMKIKVASSNAGGFSGTSGRQKLIHVCISAMEKGPDKRSVLHGLK